MYFNNNAEFAEVQSSDCHGIRDKPVSYTLLNKQIEAGRVVRDLNGCLVLKREVIK